MLSLMSSSIWAALNLVAGICSTRSPPVGAPGGRWHAITLMS
jgi:hypothetical protein